MLTGSAGLSGLRTVPDLLPGRLETVRLWPLTQSELARRPHDLVDRLFRAEIPIIADAPIGRDAFVPALVAGGYPEAQRRDPSRRTRWFRDYLRGVLEHDLTSIADLKSLDEVPKLLTLLAAQAGGIVQYRNLSSRLSIDDKTVKSYAGLLERLFLVRLSKAWRPGIGKRELHAPKSHIVDSGLLAFLLNADAHRVATDDQITGGALESFCAMELLRHADAMDDPPTLYHYRDGRDEVDLVLENRRGDIVCVEVKAAATVRPRDHRVLASLRDARGARFRAGVVLYTGPTTIPLGDRLWAVPISGLWS